MNHLFYTFPHNITGARLEDTCTSACDRDCLLPTIKQGGGFVMIWVALSWFSAVPIATQKRTENEYNGVISLHSDYFAEGWLRIWSQAHEVMDTARQDVLEQGVKDSHTAPTILTEFWIALANIPQIFLVERLKKLFEYMSRHVAAVIEVRGGPTRYLVDIINSVALQCI
ncbi:hypothetical protein TNCV_3735311 [Trichonephila clavipes]|nr:hypothetical protein TNCV_3735311 [Trichonephila clavipes]